jgi:hypothetical protein
MKLRQFFDKGDFERVIAEGVGVSEVSPCEVASLMMLSHFLVYQKEKRSLDFSGSQSKPKGANHVIDTKYEYVKMISENTHARYSNDPFVNYIYAIVLQERPDLGDGRYISELLVRAIKQGPYLWCAWSALAQRSDALDDETEALLVGQELFPYFKLERFRRQRKYKAVLSEITKLGINGWSYLDDLEGTSLYSLRKFEASASAFERIISRNKFDLNGMDEYSNVLFVLEREQDLSQLASHVCFFSLI